MADCKHKEGDLTPKEVAYICNKHYRTILKWIQDGKFPNAYICEVCGTNLVPSSDVKKYIETLYPQ